MKNPTDPAASIKAMQDAFNDMVELNTFMRETLERIAANRVPNPAAHALRCLQNLNAFTPRVNND